MDSKQKSLSEILAETPELMIRGDWACLNVNMSVNWPNEPQAFAFDGLDVWIMPRTTDCFPGLVANRPANMDRDDCFALLHRALSVLAWCGDFGAVVAHMSEGSVPHMIRSSFAARHGICGKLDLSDLPAIEKESAKLALALMREGRGLNHPAYSFLSFFRVLETAIPDGKKRGAWVTANIDQVEGRQAKEALDKLKESVQGDIGLYLRDSGRHAIAHAQGDPIIDPDKPRDARRLAAELPIIEALAVLAIEQHFGIQTSRKVFREHLYELRGWRSVFPQTVIEASQLTNPGNVQVSVDLPSINFRLRSSEPFKFLEGMTPVHVALVNPRIELVYRSADQLAEMTFWLNFADERLEFDLEQSFKVYDNGTAAAARNGKDRSRFIWDYFGNGEIQIWNAETEKLISRVEGFMPLNVYSNLVGHMAELAAWDKVIAEREKAESVS